MRAFVIVDAAAAQFKSGRNNRQAAQRSAGNLKSGDQWATIRIGYAMFRTYPMRYKNLFVLFACTFASTAAAQTVLEEREDLAFDRPESWAMAYMSASSLFSGFAVPRGMQPGSLLLGTELGHIPHISTEDRRVGFDGTKLEDLNKTPVFGRLRLWAGLPADFVVELNWTPPVEINGATPRGMAGIALERPVIEHERWRAGARVHYQRGSVRGDITCDADTASFPIGSPENPFGCRAPSDDRFELNSYGVELSASTSLADGRIEPYAAFALTRLEPRTRVNAETFGVIDRTLLVTDGNIRTMTLGLVHRPAPRWEVLAALAWTPLHVRRPPDRDRSRDDLWSARLMLRYHLR